MIAFRDSLYDGQLLRTMGHCTYGGAEIGECLATARTITERDRDSWHGVWMKLADRTLAAARTSRQVGHHESARTAFLRASNYYRNAYVFHLESPLPQVVRDAHRQHRAAFAEAAAVMRLPLEPLAVPFEGSTLPGYFCPSSRERRPVIVSVGGYDSTAEESYFWNGAAALARGYHCVVFDGPGQGAALIDHGLPFRPDWEKAVSAVIDAVATRPDVDPTKIVLIGESWGGYLAPRAAASDRRVAACVLDPAQIGLFRAFLARLPLPAGLKSGLPHGPPWLVAILRRVLGRMAKKPTAGWALRRGMLTHGVATPYDYFVEAARYEQEEIIWEIRCPTLVCDAESDEISAFSKAFFDQLRCEKQYLRFSAAEGAGEHCVSGNRALFHERVFDWIDTVVEPQMAVAG